MNNVTASGRSGVAVGRILAPHGVAGLLKVLPLTDFPERCEQLTDVVCELNGCYRRLTVERATLHGKYWLIKISGIDSCEEAADLRGMWILIPPEERVSLPAGRYYYDQLIGLMVYNKIGERIGQLREVIPGAAHDHYLIQSAGPGKKKFLLPAVKEFILEIDLSGYKIVADPPVGLLDL